MKTTKPILVTCRHHWIAYVPSGILCFLILIVGVAGLTSGGSAGLGFIGFAMGLFAIDYLLLHSNYIILREDAVVGKVGFIKTTKMVTPITKVQNISVHSGLFGKILGYSTITVETAGSIGAEFVFKRVANADEFQQKYIELANK